MKCLPRLSFCFLNSLLLPILGTLALSVHAEQASSEWLLAKYDLNGDAVITQDEIAHKKTSIFRRLDMNQDGLVSFDEYETMDLHRRHALLKGRFGKLDVNRDGNVSHEEYRDYMGSFSSIDTDGDGVVSPKEVAGQNENTVAQASPANTHCLLWFCVKTQLD